MFNFKFSFASTKKKLFIIDGDCCLYDTWAYESVLGNSEAYFVFIKSEIANLPKELLRYPELVPVPLLGYRTSKETVDKYIAMLLQKAIVDGYTDINIVSKDFDMLDIVDMAIDINSPEKFVRINVIMPNITNGIAKSADLGQKVSHNFEKNVYLVKRKK